MHEDNVFAGESGLLDYLNPGNGHMSPLVELPEALNPFKAYNVHIHAKILSAMPLSNVKSIPAFHMLDKATPKQGAHKIIESSSGNTAASLGVMAPYFGYDEVHAFVSHEVAPGKLQMLQLFNVKPIVNREPICPSEHDATSGIKKARAMGQDPEWFNPDQYANPHNLQAHYTVTGPEIWRQTAGKVDYLVAGMGTTGTLSGSAQFLKEQNPAMQAVGVVRSPNNPVPGPRTRNLLNDISFDWGATCDHVVDIGTVESYDRSLDLIRAGILAGPSSGMNLAGAYRFIQSKVDDGSLPDANPVHVVFTCCDQPFPYMDEYFKILPAERFPDVENRKLLQFSQNMQAATKRDVPQIDPDDLFALMQQDDERVKVIDMRSRRQFDHYHIPNAINIPQDEFITAIDDFAGLYAEDDLFFVCEAGQKSQYLCRHARSRNLNATSLQGGMMEWSNRDLPRIKNEACLLPRPIVA